jgi:microcystin degradation protein MlrC
MKRIGIAALMQESNSFAPRPATLEDFRILRGAAIREGFEGTNSEIGGFLKACEDEGWEAAPLVSFQANSGGPVSRDCFAELAGDLCAAIAAQPLDGLLLALHGAMSSEGFVHADAEVARRVRSAAGTSMPIAATHDSHANVSHELFEHLDYLAGYHTYPHVDQRATGLRAASGLARVLAGETAVHWHLPIPMLIPPHASATDEEPMLSAMTRLAADFPEAEASIYYVQPWLDYSPVATSIVVSDFSQCPGTPDRMVDVARRLWALRREFHVPWVAPGELASRIDAETVRPVLVSEAHDSPSGGAAGDHTGLLEALLPHSDRLRACLWLLDAGVAAQASAAGAGALVNVSLGAKIDRRWARPLELTATVVRLTDGEFVFRGPAFQGLQVSMGPTAVLAIGKLRVVVASRSAYGIDPEMFRSHGIEPLDQDVVGLKSPTLFRAAFSGISRTILYLDMPGPCSGRFEAMPYRAINRPIYPLDDFCWAPGSGDVRSITRGHVRRLEQPSGRDPSTAARPA